jgi:aminoglycoside phosphotransferase (APT) family kinase protein
LDTRPDEFDAMKSGPLKAAPQVSDEKLNNAHYQTILHGDAKVANFCFAKDMNLVAAVDFQYVGGGCGMKDLAYLIGSCLSEADCEHWEGEILFYYFKELKLALELNNKSVNFAELEQEWRSLFSYAWTDFSRFLEGWLPTHQKLNNYTKKMELVVLGKLEL